MSYVLDYQQNRLNGESKFRKTLDLMLQKFSCPLDLMRQKFCKTPWSGGSCCRNSAAPLISRCRNSAITLDVVLQKFYKTPWFHTAEILQDPLNSCYRNSARPLIACCRNSAAPLIACCRNSAAPDFILLDLMLYKFCSLLIWCWCRRISLSLVTRCRIISRLCCKGYQRLQSFYGTGYHRLQSFLITYYQGLQNFCIMGNHIV